MGVVPFVEAQRVNVGAVDAVLEAGKAVVPPGPGQPDAAVADAGLGGEAAVAEQEAPLLLRGVGRGSENGEKVDRKRVISVVSRCLNPYEEADFSAMMEVARSPKLEYVVSNTTEAGIVYDPACQLHDRPAASFPGKLTQVLLERHAAGCPGLVILSCELIDNNGRELLKCVNQYIDQGR